MDQEERKQHVWCHHGLLRRSRNVRVNRSLHVILASTKIQKWSWSVRWRRPRNLQGHSKRNWKTQARSLPSVQIEWPKITIEADKKVVNFLDVTFNLTNGCYKLLMKPDNKLSYVHQQSNHPLALLKNIPLNINKRLTSISSSKEVFDEAIAPYQKALTESGYDHKLTYNPLQGKALKNKRKRTRNIAWYNPPFNSHVRTNLGRKFLHIVDKYFPKNHPLHSDSTRFSTDTR